MENWLQGNWNAWVVFGCDINQSRERCREVPETFREGAVSHAKTYWQVQGHQPRPVKRKPASRWPMIQITAKHWEMGRRHLKGADRDRLINFGDQKLGFAAEYAVADWFRDQGVDPHHNPDPRGTDPDYTINGFKVDLKSVSTKGYPRRDHDANLAERQRKKDIGKIDFYLFGKHDKRTDGDYYIVGFLPADMITEIGQYYDKGDITRCNMNAPANCWCVQYGDLVDPSEWLK